MKKKPILLIALAILFVSAALVRLPDGIRTVDVVSLLGVGILAGALLVTGIMALRTNS